MLGQECPSHLGRPAQWLCDDRNVVAPVLASQRRRPRRRTTLGQECPSHRGMLGQECPSHSASQRRRLAGEQCLDRNVRATARSVGVPPTNYAWTRMSKPQHVAASASRRRTMLGHKCPSHASAGATPFLASQSLFADEQCLDKNVQATEGCLDRNVQATARSVGVPPTSYAWTGMSKPQRVALASLPKNL